jgi:hypothetical protein
MAQTAQAYGLVPLYDEAGQTRAKKYNILNNAGAGYGTNIFKGALVVVGTNGTIEIGTGTAPALGVFMGCEYTDSTGKPCVSPNWVASTALLAGTEAVAWVIDNQNTTYRVGVSANASGYVQLVVGQQCNLDNNGTGSTITGQAAGSVANAAIAAGTLAQLRIEGFYDGIYDATNNPFPQLLVKLVEVQFAPNAVGV